MMPLALALGVLALGTIRRLLGVERRAFYHGFALLLLWLACMAAPGIVERIAG